jgi:putative transposase
MPNSYTQIFIQYIFAVNSRENFIDIKYNDELQKYITGIIQNRKCKLLAINNVPDHMHILTAIHPTFSISKLIQEIKANSSKFINEKKWSNNKFKWQEGYGAFSYSKSQIDTVVKYINNQQEHHKTKTFKEEYIGFLNKYTIEYDKKYLFEFYN